MTHPVPIKEICPTKFYQINEIKRFVSIKKESSDNDDY